MQITTVKNTDIPIELFYLAGLDDKQIKKYFITSIFKAAIINNEIVGVIVLNQLTESEIEIVCIAILGKWQNKSIGKKFLEEGINYSKENKYKNIIIKTGNSSLKPLSMYMKCGFKINDIIPDYFLENYKEIIIENGIQCTDQVQLIYVVYDEEELNEKILTYWKKFIELNPEFKDCKYDVWSFGGNNYQSNYLLYQVLEKIKTATCSALELYEEGEKRPEQNDISIITYGNGLPGCIIKYKEITYKRFSEISEHEARLEGEGDLTLDSWQRSHEDFFTYEYSLIKKEFTNNIPLIFEVFEVIWVK